MDRLVLLTAASLYAGFQWTIRSLVYPQLARVRAEDSAAFERAHQSAVSVTVAPLFLALGASCLWALAREPRLLTVLALVDFAGLLALTALGAVPRHRRLGAGFDAQAHRGLLRVDSLRLVLAVTELVLALVLALS